MLGLGFWVGLLLGGWFGVAVGVVTAGMLVAAHHGDVDDKRVVLRFRLRPAAERRQAERRQAVQRHPSVPQMRAPKG